MSKGWADVADEADRAGGVGAGGGFLGVGPAVAIGVGGGIEVRSKLAAVVFSLPEVADAVLVGVVDGMEVEGGS